ncbi:MAG: prolyl aminopeptidase [Acidimicrobiia bacterium]|nr:prolyl aminopeptidase [Acidimicrobiia bacterium]MYE72256.1 prolyl aminopeptidase [Acidimicrobiia bacterium]MYJ63078.1 prolyl aminopeptidase [Acidimicrobiia bacterium]
MTGLFPEVEPYDAGLLGVGDGNRVYWETCGNPEGKPAVVVHGGPGSGCTPTHRRFFDPALYRIVLFDQRGSGRSAPHAGDFDTSLEHNTTDHLVRDMEALRSHLAIDRWLVFGNSWGSTLALLFGQRHPERVSEMVLLAVTSTDGEEIRWLYHGAGRIFPEAWERFHAGAGVSGQEEDLVSAYYHLLNSPDPVVREQAAADWCRWEDALVSGSEPNPRYEDPRFRMAFARIVTHYFHHGAWLEPRQIIRNAHRLHGIPAVLIHGQLDHSAPLATARELTGAWPDSELVVVDAGHLATEPAMVEAAVTATNRFGG